MSDSLVEKRQQQREKMLIRLYRESHGSTSIFMPFHELSEEEGIEENESSSMLTYLSDLDFILPRSFTGQVTITVRGIYVAEKLLSPGQSDDNSRQSNVVNVHTVHGGLQVGGHHNVQNVSYSSNDAVSEALLKIIEAIKVSPLDEHDKADALHNLQQLQKISQQEKTPGLIERAKKYFDFAQSGIKAGTEIAKVTAQYWPVIAHHFGLLTP